MPFAASARVTVEERVRGTRRANCGRSGGNISVRCAGCMPGAEVRGGGIWPRNEMGQFEVAPENHCAVGNVVACTVRLQDLQLTLRS